MTSRKPEPPPGSQLRHDLRTPINQILGYAEMLQEDATEQGVTGFVPDLEKVQRAARDLLALVDRIPDAIGPVGAAPSASPRAAAAVPIPVPSMGPGSPKEATLLVVDDNELNRDMLSRRLKGRGYTVLTAEDGQQALDLVAARPFDLILLDIMMPVLSGIDVLKVLRETHSLTELPVIMATAKDQGEDIVEALTLGANDYVTKPLDFPVVLARTETQLALKRANEEVRRLAQELEVRNRFIQQTFGRYLSDEVVRRLLETPEGLRLGGEKREVTLLMADLRGFTAMADRYPPEQIVRMLNNYLGAMAEIITRYQGTIDEFIGDAILALFGAPETREDDAERAAACAVAMQLALEEVNARHREEGLPLFEMGVAVHTGEVIVGNLGSHTRTKYGVVGTHVNLTGRMEGFTVGGQVLVSDSTRQRAGGTLEVGDRLTFAAKGFRDPVAVYDLRGVGGRHGLKVPQRTDDLQELRTPLAVEIAVLEGKRMRDATFAGALPAVSLSAARLQPEQPVAALSNLRMRLRDASGQPVPGDLYGKVTAVEAAGTVRVRFTSADPEVTETLKEALAGAKP
jgi:class 3 adenylate cyclase